ncbi:hypothetical protein [Microbulbifer sp. GL-2]|uniref:hypothetical protein n=1 Tax=Microbulbifer sp. GL-2 TaxID=2591606 RepID=UPI00155AC41D|nr:hypothetical protein [Microbulbifer sp. GL-2]
MQKLGVMGTDINKTFVLHGGASIKKERVFTLNFLGWQKQATLHRQYRNER